MFCHISADDDDEPEESAKVGSYNKLIMPEFVISLEAKDDFLKQRIMNLPESQVVGTHNTEDGLVRRLDAFRNSNTEEDTVLNYFDELEFHPEKMGKYLAWCKHTDKLRYITALMGPKICLST